MTDNKKKEIDEVTGVETTGHEWDGLKELNNPAPRWWVWVFLITIIWSVWYFVEYPSWPVPGAENQGGTVGASGYTQYKELAKSQEDIVARQESYMSKFQEASFEEILSDPALYAFALAGGKSAFKDNCATCHGTGADGSKGYPNLNDDDWIWGGKLTDIHQTLLYGIRDKNIDSRVSQMPAFGKEEILNREEINQVVDYVLSLSGDGHGGAHVEKGQAIFQEQCASCHGADGKGLRELGAPNLTDAIWLYGGDHHSVFESVYNSHAGMMPAWEKRLDPQTIRQLAVYVHQLGGGEPEEDETSESYDDTPSFKIVPVLNDPMFVEAQDSEE